MCALLAQSGCSALAASVMNHNSRGTSCMDEPIFPAIDLIGGSLGALALVYTEKTDESPGWLAVPGVFLLSGVIASFTVYACRHPDPDETTGGVARPATPDAYELPPNNAIPQDRTDEESDVRDATLEERGMTVPPFEPVKDVEKAPAPLPQPTVSIKCSINPLTQCPEGQSCVLVDGDRGFCRPDVERSKPKANPPRS